MVYYNNILSYYINKGKIIYSNNYFDTYLDINNNNNNNNNNIDI